MSKTPLPTRIESGDLVYQLIYIPGLPAGSDARYCVPPPAADWRAISGGMRTVQVPGEGERYLGWTVMQQPPMPGSAIPPRNYLFLFIRSMPFVQQQMDPSRNMICYAMQPKESQADPIQAFVNALFGGQVQPEPAPVDGWVEEMFSLPKDDGSGVS